MFDIYYFLLGTIAPLIVKLKLRMSEFDSLSKQQAHSVLLMTYVLCFYFTQFSDIPVYNIRFDSSHCNLDVQPF